MYNFASFPNLNKWYPEWLSNQLVFGAYVDDADSKRWYRISRLAAKHLMSVVINTEYFQP